jgi:hypothetical protein
MGEAIFGEFGKVWWPNSISGDDVLEKKLKGLHLFKQEQQGINLVIREPIPQKRKIINSINAIPRRLRSHGDGQLTSDVGSALTFCPLHMEDRLSSYSLEQ